MSSALRFRPVRAAECDTVVEQLSASFGATGDDAAVGDRVRQRIESGQMWGVDDGGGGLLGNCRLLLVDHWFGGRPVRSMDIAAVAVPPEHRGQGVARALMEGAVAWGAHQRAGLSLLFPATTSLYRKLGWDHAGTFSSYRLEARAAPAVGEAMRPMATEDWAQIKACHDRYAATLQGPGVRTPDQWDRLSASRFGYVLDGVAGIEAYVLLNHRSDPGDWQYTLAFADWAATTPRGMRAVVALIGRHGTLGKDATFHAPLPDVWALWADEQWDVQHVDGFFWMARSLALPAAIAARGFGPGVDLQVTLRVEDPLLAEARGPWCLAVRDGRGSLQPADDAEVVAEMRAVGPLFTGFRSPQQLALAGLLDGPEDALARLGTAFAGPAPLLLDFF